MPVPFNYSNATGLQGLFEYGNEVTSPAGYNYFGDLLVVAVWIVAWAVFSAQPVERAQLKAMIVSSFAAFFFAVALDLVQLVDKLMVALPFAILALSIVADMIQEKT